MAVADRILLLKLVTDLSDLNKGAKALKQWGKAAALGAVIEGFDLLSNTVSTAWDGFREGQRVAGQLGVAWKNMGFAGSQLDTTLQKVTDSTLALGTSDDEAVKAFTESLKWTKDYTKSLDYLTIAQDLVANGSAPNLSSAFEIIRKVGLGSKRVLDKFGITAGTAGDMIGQLGGKVKGAAEKAAKLDPFKRLSNSLAEDWETIVASLAEGDIDGAIGAISQAVTDFDTAWANLFPDLQPVLDKLTGGQFSTMATKVGGLLDKVNEIAPHFQAMWDLVQPILAISGIVLDLLLIKPIEIGSMIIGTALDAVSGAFTGMKKDIDLVAGQVGSIVNDMVVMVVDALNSINDLSWGGGSFDLYNIDQAVADFLRIPSNGKIHYPSGNFQLWPDLGYPGSGGADADGSHKGGLDYVPWDGYMAELHRGERVQTASEASDWRSGNGGMGSGITINIGIAGDPVSTGREIDRILQQYYRRSGGVTAR